MTAWADAVAEAMEHAPERVDGVLADARPGAPWRRELGLPEPSAPLADRARPRSPTRIGRRRAVPTTPSSRVLERRAAPRTGDAPVALARGGPPARRWSRGGTSGPSRSPSRLTCRDAEGDR